MRYRTLETQLQTFLYWDSFALTCSSGEKSTGTLLLSPMPMTAPIYSAMEQPSEWVLQDPARSLTETVPGKMPFRFYAR